MCEQTCGSKETCFIPCKPGSKICKHLDEMYIGGLAPVSKCTITGQSVYVYLNLDEFNKKGGK